MTLDMDESEFERLTPVLAIGGLVLIGLLFLHWGYLAAALGGARAWPTFRWYWKFIGEAMK